MAQFSVNAQRFDPYKNFKFRVKWDGKYVAGVHKVGALKRTTEVVEHREGGDPSTGRKSPGRTKFEAITLERGVTHDKEFELWANKVWNFGAGLGAEVSLKDFRKPGSLRSRTKSSAVGSPSFRLSPISMPTPMLSRSNRSNWRMRVGCATTRCPSQPSRASRFRHN